MEQKYNNKSSWFIGKCALIAITIMIRCCSTMYLYKILNFLNLELDIFIHIKASHANIYLHFHTCLKQPWFTLKPRKMHMKIAPQLDMTPKVRSKVAPQERFEISRTGMLLERSTHGFPMTHFDSQNVPHFQKYMNEQNLQTYFEEFLSMVIKMVYCYMNTNELTPTYCFCNVLITKNLHCNLLCIFGGVFSLLVWPIIPYSSKPVQWKMSARNALVAVNYRVHDPFALACFGLAFANVQWVYHTFTCLHHCTELNEYGMSWSIAYHDGWRCLFHLLNRTLVLTNLDIFSVMNENNVFVAFVLMVLFWDHWSLSWSIRMSVEPRTVGP